MDEATLAYHTKLHQWYELHKLNRSGDMGCLNLPEDGTHLTPQKAVEIDQWRQDVNKTFMKPKKAEKKELFWRCHVSAPASATKHGSQHDPRKVKSARHGRQSSKACSVDVDTLPAHLAEMSIYYSREHAGLREDLQVNGSKHALHIPQQRDEGHNIGAWSRKGGFYVTVPQGESEIDVITLADSVQATASSSQQEQQQQQQQEPVYRKSAFVSDRSQSNNLLNFVSIDDCKLASRYRPQRVITTYDEMEGSTGASTSDDHRATVPLRVSHGSGLTLMTPGMTSSIISGQRAKHKQLLLNGTNIQPAQSSILTRAFDVILQEKSILAIPTHAKEVRFLAIGKTGASPRRNCGATTTHSPRGASHSPHSKHLYDRLNTTLKNKMNTVVNSHWCRARSRDSGSARVQYGSNRGNIVCKRVSIAS